jgi:hypothetical protein
MAARPFLFLISAAEWPGKKEKNVSVRIQLETEGLSNFKSN